MPNNKDVLNALANVESYITSTINASFAPITVTKLISYDNPQNTLVGTFLANNGITYSFYIAQTDGLPLIKPISSK